MMFVLLVWIMIVRSKVFWEEMNFSEILKLFYYGIYLVWVD